MTEFRGCAPCGICECLCFPGLAVMTVDAAQTRTHCASSCVSTSDLGDTRSEDQMEEYRRVIRHNKGRTASVIVSGVLPWMRKCNDFYSEAFSTNNRPKSLCAQENVDFVNFWNNFYRENYLYARDGVHLHLVGAARH